MMLRLFFFLIIRRPPRSTRTDTLFPYTTLFRSLVRGHGPSRDLDLAGTSQIDGLGSVFAAMAVDGVDGAQPEGLDGLDTGEVHFRKSGLGGNKPAPSGRRRLLPRALSIILPLIPAPRQGRGSKHGNKNCDKRPSNAI